MPVAPYPPGGTKRERQCVGGPYSGEPMAFYEQPDGSYWPPCIVIERGGHAIGSYAPGKVKNKTNDNYQWKVVYTPADKKTPVEVNPRALRRAIYFGTPS